MSLIIWGHIRRFSSDVPSGFRILKSHLGNRLRHLRATCDSIITKQKQDWKPVGRRTKLSDWC